MIFLDSTNNNQLGWKCSSIRRQVTLLYKNDHPGLKKMAGPGTFTHYNLSQSINIVYKKSDIWSNIKDFNDKE